LNVSLGTSTTSISSISGNRLLVSTSRLLTHELTLGARAEGRLLTLPVALGLFAHGGTHGVRSGTGSTTLSGSADSLTLGAVSLLAHVLGASHVTLRLVTVNLTSSTRSLLTMNLALRSLTYRMTLSRADWIITLPSTLRMAITFYFS